MPDGTGQGGSRDVAFVAFYDRYHGQVYDGLALTLRDPELAADCTQEAMVRAYQRWSSIDPAGNPAGWLYRVGLNAARSRWRRVRRELLGLVGDRPDPRPVPSTPDPQLDRALEALPVEQRAVVVLRFLLDWSVQDVAEALNVAPGTVKSRQHRALDRLRDELEEAHGRADARTRDAG